AHPPPPPGPSTAPANDSPNPWHASDRVIPPRSRCPTRDAIQGSSATRKRRYPLFQRDDGLRRPWHSNGFREDVVATELDPIQCFVINRPHDFSGHQSRPVFDRGRSGLSPIELMRSTAFVPNQLLHRLGHDAAGESIFSTPERSQILHPALTSTPQTIT